MNSTLIFEDENILCFYTKGQSQYLLITFSPANFKSCQNIPYWGADFSSKNCVTTIGIVAKKNNWFPKISMRYLKDIMIKFTARFNHIISYGTSMGGFGALKYGSLIGATHSVVFAPQFSIEPELMSNLDRRYFNYFDLNLNNNMAITPLELATNVSVFYDPYYKEDKYNASKISKLSSNISFFITPFMHHFPIELFIGSVRTLELFDMVIAGDHVSIKSRLYERRKKSETRIRYLIEIISSRNPYTASKFHSKYSVNLNKNNNAWLCGVISDAYTRIEDIDNAKKYADISIRLAPDNITFLRRLSSIYLRLNEYPKATEYIFKAIHIKPSDINLLNALVSVYLKINEHTKAHEVLLTAIEIEPNNRDLLVRLTSVLLMLKKPQEALKYAANANIHYPNDKVVFNGILNTYSQLGLFENCLTICEEAFSYFGLKVASEVYIAICIKNKRYMEISEFTEKYFPENWSDILSNDIAYQLFLALGNDELAEVALLKDLKKQPNEPNILFRLCSLKGKMGKKSEALSCAHQAWDFNKLDVNISIRYISTLIWFGEKEKAQLIINETEMNHPSNKLLIEQRLRL
jgi:tetratricopeptide (TPR) repeat protein